jgi:hypothetical protein
MEKWLLLSRSLGKIRRRYRRRKEREERRRTKERRLRKRPRVLRKIKLRSRNHLFQRFQVTPSLQYP